LSLVINNNNEKVVNSKTAMLYYCKRVLAQLGSNHRIVTTETADTCLIYNYKLHSITKAYKNRKKYIPQYVH